ncbi:MAG: MBOAT family protein, partial [Zavarzinella sp.]|nr:MBOAT family protein [Zavarzinella sp.]
YTVMDQSSLQGLTTASLAPAGLSLNSTQFLIFAFAAVVVFRVLLSGRPRVVALAGFNLYFFLQFFPGWFPLAVFGGLVLFTWTAGRLRKRYDERFPTWLYVAIVLALWAFLFLAKDPELGGEANPFHGHPVAWIGLSYMVFRCIQFVMDVEVLDDVGLITLLNHLLFFPTLLAGPIERNERFQQFQRGEDLSLNESPLPALHRIANGYLKKYVIADNLSAFGIFAMPAGETWPAPMLWLGVLLQFALLYLDLSGYNDIMIGLARLMGFRLTENFNEPWKARNIQEFWARWHITLSEFVRDYVFTPLARRIVSTARPRWHWPLTMAVSFLAMMVIALWHGTSTGFFVYGLLHGSALVLLQVWRRIQGEGRAAGSWLDDLVARGLTMLFVSVTVMLWFHGPARTADILWRMLGGGT